MSDAPLIGVLALQGDFEAHGAVLRRLGASVREVRVPVDLEGLDGLVIPGGESTTMTLGVEREGLAEPLRELARRGGAGGIPVLGSCAGLIMLDRDHLGIMDIMAKRNAFGRQLRSFEAEMDVHGVEGGPLRGVFIRAPWIAEHGTGVEILAEVDGHPVAARQGGVLAVAFHTELGRDDRLHRLFLADVAASDGAGEGAGVSASDTG
jgi:pyridoxal 5'-phosphate synthase pdxT subunit